MPLGREGPSHARLRSLIVQHLTAVKPRPEDRAALSDWIGRLYALRIQADYQPSALVGRLEAREALILMTKVFDTL